MADKRFAKKGSETMSLKQILNKYKKPSKKGFSLVEMMATVAVLAISAGATITVFLMVQDVMRKESTITVEQYNTTQVERFIRNELQVASKVDFYQYDASSGSLTNMEGAYSAHENDEYMVYDPGLHSVRFCRADNSGTYSTVLTIDNVDEVFLAVTPLNESTGGTTGEMYKLFYTISTTNYEYSGGFMLNNCKVGDGSMSTATFNAINSLTWSETSLDNEFVLAYHRESSSIASSTSSTP